MKLNKPLRAALLAVSLSAAAGLVVARSSNMVDPGRQTLATTDAGPMTIEAMRQAVIGGGAQHGWKPVGDQPGLLTLEVDSGKHQAVVDVAYDGQGYTITYKSSANLNYEHTDTKTSIHPKYNKWVDELNASIHRAAVDAQMHAH